ncbi:hypothetical protein OIO90_003210 [Microbotryomycetes sp. JL221]|nr:hypothetical protein OIO90_003210 [Microbotryomycetes sp. JL221]
MFDSDGRDGPLPPGYSQSYEQVDHASSQLGGPWLQTQLELSLGIGVTAFLLFCLLRKLDRCKVLYAPRTLLKGFSPHEVHDTSSLFGWILPTLRTSEFTVLQIVGLDAAVLLSFFRTCFLFFLTLSVLAWTVLVPINYRENGSSEGVPQPRPHKNNTDSLWPNNLPLTYLDSSSSSTLWTSNVTELTINKVKHGSTVYLTSHLVFTYVFTILAFLFLQRNWRRYIPLRQLFSLELTHSIPARTIMCTNLPPHLRSERALAEYFESIRLGELESTSLGVDSVTVTRAVGGMKQLLDERTKSLKQLEKAWTSWLGNPAPVNGKKAVENYDPELELDKILDPEQQESIPTTTTTTTTTSTSMSRQGRTTGSRLPRSNGRLIDFGHDLNEDDETDRQNNQDDDENIDLEAHLLTPSIPTIVNPNKKRPTLRLSWFSKKVDALDFYAQQFKKADQAVVRRRKGRFRPTGVAFVTFQTLAAAQIAAQTVHYPHANVFETELAPEPRDINWSNLSLSKSARFIRKIMVTITLLVLLSVWLVPVLFLAQLLSWKTIKDTAPRLAEFIGKSPRLRGFVQTSLPSLAMVAFNNILPFFLDGLSVFQGLQARSWIEYSLLKKYHLTLLFTTLFAFVTSSTLGLLRELSQSPQKVLDKLATTLPGGRNFFVSYVMLSGLAFMPLQLLELATVIPRWFYVAFITRTPRDHAELNRPSMVNLGTVYPQALLMFTIGMTYSIISPLVLPFTTLYFGMAYLVYKYKFLFVYYRPYESRGQAWPLAFNRMGWALLIMQLFMFALFTVRKAFLLSGSLIPLFIATAYTTWSIGNSYKNLSRFVNLSQACAATNGTNTDVVRLRRGHPVTSKQTNLNRGRYKHNGEGIYVVGKNNRTDYSQPPMSESFPGVLNTGSRLYNHPALTGPLPEPWLPILAEPDLKSEIPDAVKQAMTGGNAVIVNLRRRWNIAKRAVKKSAQVVSNVTNGRGGGGGVGNDGIPRSKSDRSMDEDHPARAWREQETSSAVPSGSRRMSHYRDDDRRDSDELTSPIEHGDYDEDEFDDEEDENLEDEQGRTLTRYSTYWHHRPSSRDQFPPTRTMGGQESDRDDDDDDER